ncbi:MAG: hypothetical protein Q9227_001458 [Pyrenula ochraceoflavens]
MRSLIIILIAATTSLTNAKSPRVDLNPIQARNAPFTADEMAPPNMVNGYHCYRSIDPQRCTLNANFFLGSKSFFGVRNANCDNPAQGSQGLNHTYKFNGANFDLTVKEFPTSPSSMSALESGFTFTIADSPVIQASFDSGIQEPEGKILMALGQDGIQDNVTQHNFECTYEPETSQSTGDQQPGAVSGICYVIEYNCKGAHDS